MLLEVGPRIRGIAGGSVDAALLDKLPKLESIAGFGVGYDTIDTGAAKSRNIRVTNSPNVLNDAVAEITIGLMIALARRIPQADRYVREGKWVKGGFPLQRELPGKTVGRGSSSTWAGDPWSTSRPWARCCSPGRWAARHSTCSRTSLKCPRPCSASTTSCCRRTRAAPPARRATPWARCSWPISWRSSTASHCLLPWCDFSLFASARRLLPSGEEADPGGRRQNSWVTRCGLGGAA